MTVSDEKMPPIDPHHATALLVRVNEGDVAAANELLPLVYEQLRALAGSYFRGQPADHSLQPTALVHEAYLKLVNAPSSNWQGRVHFCAVAATAMRQILHDRARRRRTAKRGGDARRVPLEQMETPTGGEKIDLVALDEALERLGQLAPRQARIVELRFFGGLTIAQAADVLAVSPATVENDWRVARAWLNRELHTGDCR
jgi:RNA polymerase sigma factor (TIGR02999 family)